MTCKFCGCEAETDICLECGKRLSALIAQNKPPCSRECMAREVGCHGQCAFFLEYRDIHERIKTEEDKKHAIDIYRSEWHQRSIDRQAKENKQKRWSRTRTMDLY